MRRYKHDPGVPIHVRRLVESARGDDLATNRRHRVAERLGILPVGSPNEPTPEPVSPTKSWVSAKGIVLGAIVLVSVGSSYVIGTGSRPIEQPTVVIAPGSVRVVAPPPIDEAGKAMATLVSIDVGALPDGPPGPAAKRPLVLRPIVEPPPAGDLRREIGALDAVRRASENGRLREALILLDSYATTFPAGKLREEAAVLRIEALHASGDQDTANRLARQLFLASPNTPYAARVRAALVRTSRE